MCLETPSINMQALLLFGFVDYLDLWVVLVESLQHLSERLDLFWRLRRLELKADYVVEASVCMIIV